MPSANRVHLQLVALATQATLATLAELVLVARALAVAQPCLEVHCL
jgi:hypothetical protein